MWQQLRKHMLKTARNENLMKLSKYKNGGRIHEKWSYLKVDYSKNDL